MVLILWYVNGWIYFFAWVFELFNVIIGVLIILGLGLKLAIIYMLLFIDLIFFFTNDQFLLDNFVFNKRGSSPNNYLSYQEQNRMPIMDIDY